MTDLPGIERRQEERKRGWEIAGGQPILNQTVNDIDTLLQELKRLREALEKVENDAAMIDETEIERTAHNALHPKEEGTG
jgi:hypothetical protein